MPKISFDNVVGSHKIVKTSSSMLANKIGIKVVLNKVDNNSCVFFL
jgi:hypothetical protein